jgi:hypothetical protein
MRYWIFAISELVKEPALIGITNTDVSSAEIELENIIVIYDTAENLPYPFYLPSLDATYVRYIRTPEQLNANWDAVVELVKVNE